MKDSDAKKVQEAMLQSLLSKNSSKGKDIYPLHHGADVPGYKWVAVDNPHYNKVSALDDYLGSLTESISSYEYPDRLKKQYNSNRNNHPYTWELQKIPSTPPDFHQMITEDQDIDQSNLYQYANPPSNPTQSIQNENKEQPALSPESISESKPFNGYDLEGTKLDNTNELLTSPPETKSPSYNWDNFAVDYINEAPGSAVPNMRLVNNQLRAKELYDIVGIPYKSGRTQLDFINKVGDKIITPTVDKLFNNQNSNSQPTYPSNTISPTPTTNNTSANNVIPNQSINTESLASDPQNEIAPDSIYPFHHGPDVSGYKWMAVNNPHYNEVSRTDAMLGRFTEGISANRYDYPSLGKYNSAKNRYPYTWELQKIPEDSSASPPDVNEMLAEDQDVDQRDLYQYASSNKANNTDETGLTLYGAPVSITGGLMPLNNSQEMPVNNNILNEMPRKQGNSKMGTVGEMPNALPTGAFKQTALYSLYGSPQNNKATTTNFVF